MSRWHQALSGRPYRRARELMFATFGRVCHLCLHDGATDADHLVPISVDSEQPIDYMLMRPAHGVNGCATCGRKCNQERGNAPIGATNTSRHW